MFTVQWDVGMRENEALETGEAHERNGDYFGPMLNRAARIMRLPTMGRSSPPRRHES
jgi:hypothetical protein